MVPDRQEVDRGTGIHGPMQHEAVTVQVRAEGAGNVCRQQGELDQCLGRLRRVVQVAPADAPEAHQIGDHCGAQLWQQVIVGKGCIRLGQERLDGVQAFQEAGRQLVRRLTRLER